MQKSRRGLTYVLVLSLSVAAQLHADEPTKQMASSWQDYFALLAKECRMTAEGSDEPFELVEQPLLRWSQPIRGGDDGAVYIWLKDQRPAAIGTIFAWPHPDGDSVVAYEFHSLRETPFATRWRGGVLWAPKMRGVSFRAVPDSQPPSESAVKRGLQLRAIARRFTGATKTSDGVERALRLLPKPIYQYGVALGTESSNEPTGFLQGALFVLAEGTDPEVLILLESRQHENVYRWEYSCARFSDLASIVRLGDKEVWSVEQANPRPNEPHYFSHFERRDPPTADKVGKLKGK